MAEEFEKYKFPVAHNDSDYADMVQTLLPKGVIWGFRKITSALVWQDTVDGSDEKQDTVDGTEIKQDTVAREYSGGKLAILMSVLGSELARIEALAWDVLNQVDPGVATENTLTDWERNLGLPGSCATSLQSVEERQRAAHSKLFDEYVVTTEQAFINKADSVGFEITVNTLPDEYQPSLCGVMRCGVNRLSNNFGRNVIEITVVDDRGNDVDYLKCIFKKFKPAHAVLIYVT